MNESDKKTLKIIYFAQIIFATVFFLVATFMLIRASKLGVVPSGSELDTVRLLSLVLIVFTMSNSFTAVFLFKKVLRGRGEGENQNLSARIRSAFILRLAIFQGLSLFGNVVYLLCGLYGVIGHNPIYWLTAGPYLLFLNIAIKTFPTSERMDSYFNEMNRGTMA